MSSFRRASVVLLGLAALAALALLLPTSGFGQKVPGGRPVLQPPVTTMGEFSAAVSLPTDKKYEQRLEAIPEYIAKQDWTTAIQSLQFLLDVPEDKFVPVERTRPDGKKAKTWSSVRTEANRLLATLPKEGLEFYQQQYNGKAKAALDEAKEKRDYSLLATVARRFLFTPAGIEATTILAGHHLDRGRFSVAALWYERLIEREGIDKLQATTLLKAALAFHHVKDERNLALKVKVLDTLKDKVGSSMRLGDKVIDLADLRAEIDRAKTSLTLLGRSDCHVFHGNAAHTGVGEGGAPFLQPTFQQETVKEMTVKTTINQAVTRWLERGNVVIPAAAPVAADGKLVFRASDGIHAVDIKTGEDKWYTSGSGSAKWSFDRIAVEGDKWGTLKGWCDGLTGSGKANTIFENSTIGTLSTDGVNVYAVDDLPVPPYFYNPNIYNPNPPVINGQALKDPAAGSRLQAYSLKTGKLVWELGNADVKEKKDEKKDEVDLKNTFFLGAPLPLHGKLYALVEYGLQKTENGQPRGQELRLLCLETVGTTCQINWSQPLAQTVNPLEKDPERRVHAAHLAYAEGILVCPTNAGAILGVDMLDHTLVWAYAYRPQVPGAQPDPNQPQPFPQPVPFPQPGQPPRPGTGPVSNQWKMSAPIIADGKVIFTAYDGDSIHCLSLRDGTELWKQVKTTDDLYLAGVQNGKAILVGKNDTRALDINDNGKQTWKTTVGTPSGLGVVSGDFFYLPLRASAKDKEPEVCKIDINNGTAVAHTKSRKKVGGNAAEVPGNLLFHEDEVISQSLDKLAVFPQLDVKKAKMEKLLAENPNDPVGLLSHGEVMLDQGNHAAAVEDIAKALANNPNPETRTKARSTLYDTLTEFLQLDFAKAETHLTTYEGLCKVEVPDDASPQDRQALAREEKRRKAAMYSLVGQGRENQGKLLEAFDAYMAFGSLGVESKELLPVIYDTSIRAPLDVLARAQIASLVEKASQKGLQKPLEERIAKKWSEIKNNDIDGLRGFVALFAAQSQVGRQARLQLAERLMEDQSTNTLLEAEQHLILLRRQTEDPQTASLAVEALARLMARKGLMHDAAYYYRVLSNEFPKVVVKDGKTGEDFFNELITDKRFWGYLDDGAAQGWAGAKLSKPKMEQSNYNPNPQMSLSFDPVGEVTPFFQRMQVTINAFGGQLRITDRATNESKELSITRIQEMNPNNWYMLFPNGQPPRMTYQVVGHMAILPVAYMVYGVDMVNKRVVWERNLLGEGSTGLAGGSRLQVDPNDGTLTIYYPDNYFRKVGKLGAIETSYVCLQSPEGLSALDPITGRTLWTRNDLSRATLFGDEQVIYAVETNNNNVAATRALRAQDGAALPAPDFTSVFQQKQKLIGRSILLSETRNNKTVLRLYDVQTGKDTWMVEFPVNSVILKTEEPNLAGAIDPEGKLTVIDLRTQKEVLKGQVAPEHIKGQLAVTLLEDSANYYLAINLPSNQQNQFPSQPMFVPQSGVRALAVNGYFYAFGKDGTLRWREDVPGNRDKSVHSQMLILEGFKDLPFVMFGVLANKGDPKVGRWGPQSIALEARDKISGKLRLSEADLMTNGAQQFMTYNIDLRTGKLEMMTWNFKMVLNMEPAEASGTK